MKYTIAPLLASHKKEPFTCGNERLDRYLKKQARQDIRRQLSVCFVLVDIDDVVMGFYTLSNASIPRNQLPSEIARKLPKAYRDLPATLLGRLAVDLQLKGQGYGKILLLDALHRTYEVSKTEVGSMVVIVDPIDTKASQFYKAYGFIRLPGSGKLFLPMKTVRKLF